MEHAHPLAVPAIVTLALLLAPLTSAAPKGNAPNPDLTKGEPIPEGYDHDWNLGATGARGWIYPDKLTTTSARQIAVTKVHPGSPADGVLQVGDVIVGVGGKPFASNARVEFGKALSWAETVGGNGQLRLKVWREGKTATVALKLPVLGSYSDTAPYNCQKSSF